MKELRVCDETVTKIADLEPRPYSREFLVEMSAYWSAPARTEDASFWKPTEAGAHFCPA
jgi:hypothetical protein